MNNNPWLLNEYGFWCPACGELLSAESEGDDLPLSCRTCGFPEFEDGPGYFTDEED